MVQEWSAIAQQKWPWDNPEPPFLVDEEGLEPATSRIESGRMRELARESGMESRHYATGLGAVGPVGIAEVVEHHALFLWGADKIQG